MLYLWKIVLITIIQDPKYREYVNLTETKNFFKLTFFFHH